MLKEVLDEVLRKKHREVGLYLEGEENFLHLKRGDKTLVTWPWQSRVTISEVWAVADEYLPSTRLKKIQEMFEEYNPDDYSSLKCAQEVVELFKEDIEIADNKRAFWIESASGAER